jgi:nifR3 family TIM-barrel protein
LFGSDIEHMRQSARIATEAGPDLIDINYGCPVKNVACRGAGAALLQDIPKMVQMTEAVVKSTHLPVTVKTRLGWDDQTRNIEEVAERLQDIGVKALTIHGRTRVQMYRGDADWTLIGKVKNNARIQIPIFGNGDIDSPLKAVEYKNRYGVDGVMIGRAAIGHPWIFNEIKSYYQKGTIAPPPTMEERVRTTKEHLLFSVKWKGERTGVLEMRRHYANYFRGIPDFKSHRIKLVESVDVNEIIDLLDGLVAMEVTA